VSIATGSCSSATLKELQNVKAFVLKALVFFWLMKECYSIGQKKSAMAKKWFGFSAIFSSALQCCF
jgi:hypothetical protein